LMLPAPTKVNLNQSVDMHDTLDKNVEFDEDFPPVPSTVKAHKSTMPRKGAALSPMQIEQSPLPRPTTVRVDKVIDNKEAAKA